MQELQILKNNEFGEIRTEKIRGNEKWEEKLMQILWKDIWIVM